MTTALSDALIAEVTFADRAETYQLLVVPPMRLANQAVEALNRAAPCLALALLAFSLLCAVGYSRYLARPIVRISSIAGRMAELDFQWKCGETRRDEIGALGRSLDEMAERLSATLAELEEANEALHEQLQDSRVELAEEKESSQQALTAMDWFWRIQRQFSRGYYTDAANMMAEFEAAGLPQYLPQEALTGREGDPSPAQQYQEIKEALG